MHYVLCSQFSGLLPTGELQSIKCAAEAVEMQICFIYLLFFNIFGSLIYIWSFAWIDIINIKLM